MVEAQIYLASRVKPMPPVRDRDEWEKYAAGLRAQILDNVVFRGEAAQWRNMPVKVEWLDTIPASGYRLRKFRYQVLPGLWLPALLYEPAELKGRVPVAINVNGHEGEGMATSYIQQRCIHLARNGVLAFNYEWYSKGQMNLPGYSHARMNQLDLTGTSGLAPFFLAIQHLLDVALGHPNADSARVAVTGLSGGGWQTILFSSLDPRVTLAAEVAGYSSFVTRTQYPAQDLGDSEQTPVDLGQYADYTHLTAMLAPRPFLLTHNAFDNCCFRADYAIGPLLVAAQPIFALLGHPERLHYHANFDQGHNYGEDNRQTFYRFLAEFFFPGGSFPDHEEPADLRTPEALRMPLPEPNEDFHTLAMRLSEKLPRPLAISAAESREKLRDIVRWTDYRVTALPAGADRCGLASFHERQLDGPGGGIRGRWLRGRYTRLGRCRQGQARGGNPTARGPRPARRRHRPLLFRRMPNRSAQLPVCPADLRVGRAAARRSGRATGGGGTLAPAEVRSGHGGVVRSRAPA